jgi:hypothetical protein
MFAQCKNSVQVRKGKCSSLGNQFSSQMQYTNSKRKKGNAGSRERNSETDSSQLCYKTDRKRKTETAFSLYLTS